MKEEASKQRNKERTLFRNYLLAAIPQGRVSLMKNESRRMNLTKRKTKSGPFFILHPSSFILSPSSFAFPSVSVMRGVFVCFGIWVFAMGGANGQENPPEQTRPQEKHEGRSRLAEGTTTRPAAGLSEIAYEDLVLLVKTARRAFQQKLAGASEQGARYRPPALNGVTAIIHVTLRSNGVTLAEAESREMDVIEAAVAAGTLLGQRALAKKLKPTDSDGYGLEFELLGPAEYLDVEYDEGGVWSEELLHAFEPAAEGIGVAFRGKRGWTRPSEVVSRNYTPDLALGAAESIIGLKHLHKLRVARDIRYFRFCAYHLWQRSAQTLPVVLVRGAVLVPPEAVGPEVLDAAIGRLGAYLHYRQNSDGWFSHVYLPSPDRYGHGNSALVQMHALEGLAAYGAWSGEADVVADVEKGLKKTALFLRPLSQETSAASTQRSAAHGKRENSGSETPLVTVRTTGETPVPQPLVLYFPGHARTTEVSAYLLSAISHQRSAINDQRLAVSSQPSAIDDPQSSIVNRQSLIGLVEGFLAAQGADGRVDMAIGQPAENAAEDAAAAGWALLALAQSDPSRGDERIEQALHRALSYYPSREDLLSDPVAAAALARAFASGYAWTNDAHASEFVFKILDQFAGLQVTEAACPWPELHGAINVRERGAIGVDTARYLAALADGLRLAERVGEKQRAKRYREAVSAAVRFVLQLEVRTEGCYYVRNPRDALGGVRASPWNNRIRADHCAEALMSMMLAREALYGVPKKD